MAAYYIKANRIFSPWRQWAWAIVFLIALGGLYEPRLGLLVLFIIAGLSITSLFKGRYWCGNFCTHGSFYDLILIKFSKNDKIPQFLKSDAVMIVFFAIFSYKIGSRMFYIFTSQFDAMTILSKIGTVFVSAYWMVLLVSVPIGLIYTSRAWCYFCPMGTFQRILYKLGRISGINKKTDVKISVEDKLLCRSCAKCSRVCPMQLQPYLEFDGNNQFSSDKCIKCKTCIKNCPVNILSLRTLR